MLYYIMVKFNDSVTSRKIMQRGTYTCVVLCVLLNNFGKHYVCLKPGRQVRQDPQSHGYLFLSDIGNNKNKL